MFAREIDTKPILTAADALKEVSPHLQLAGEPRLEYNGSKLLYRITVEGIAGLNAVYVDANTGQYEYIDYEYQILR